ncbi:hypothetical protein AB1Y20_003715 [Prymnesium parvum]|uniref:Sulfotransferase domain-containing protein n=1 Tax=Prymnesium parvum TaxID=97485 RepID=A0AB34J7S8_PRYPA
MAVCASALRDCFTPASSGVALGRGGAAQLQSDAQLIAQLDRPQLAAVTVLQLLRHSLGGECGALRLIHTRDWPELRLADAAAAPPDGPAPSALPALCPPRGGEAWSRLLDLRCHVPNGTSPLRLLLPPAFSACLDALARGAAGALSHLLRRFGRADRAADRAALSGRAALLRRAGLAAALRTLGARRGVEARCGALQCAAAGGAAPRRRGHPLARVAAAHLRDGGDLLPSEFDRRFRSPCWRCNLSAPSAEQLCCLPYAHILGVSKCGTTDLYARLALHPEVLPSENKGPHFWDEPHELRWYLRLYERSAARLLRGQAPRSGVLLDASSNTLTFSGIGIRGEPRPSPPLLLPQVMAWLQPALKLLVMLREPAARYYSAYTYYNRRYRIYESYGPQGPRSFGRMALADMRRFDECRRTHSARRCGRSLFYQAQQLVKGLYSLFLRDWVCSFPPPQLLVIRLEDYEAAPRVHLAAVIGFLSLSPIKGRRWERMLSRPRANAQRAGTAAGTRGPSGLPDETRALLSAFYAPFNEELAALMGGEERFLWLDRGGVRANVTFPSDS